MIKLLVVSDDLTGALDSGVQLAKAGIPTEVKIFSDQLNTLADKIQPDSLVLVVDTESRHISPEAAYRRVADTIRWAQEQGIPRLYKKTDSTLRGNLGPEMAALIDNGNGLPLIFVPAFPALGRTTEGGRQYVYGVPLEDTEFARDPLNPMNTSQIDAIINTNANLEVREVEPSGLTDLLKKLREEASAEKPLVVLVNGRSEKDLEETARALALFFDETRPYTPSKTIKHSIAGCAGFAAYLPGLLKLKKSKVRPPRLPKPLVVVNGSLNPVALAQARHALAQGFLDLPLEPEGLQSPEIRRNIVQKISEAAEADRACVVRTVLTEEDFEDYTGRAEKLGIPREQMHRILPQLLGEILHQAAKETVLGTMVIFGGDTLGGILASFGKGTIIPLTETFPGVVTAQIPEVLNPRYLISKAGGFGEEDFLSKLLLQLD